MTIITFTALCLASIFCTARSATYPNGGLIFIPAFRLSRQHLAE